VSAGAEPSLASSASFKATGMPHDLILIRY
jgi:hypothetical protein